MTVTYWKFDVGGTYSYTFPRNPDRNGGDSYWVREIRMSELSVIGSSKPYIQVDGFNAARRNIKFTAITGTMMRTLQTFYSRYQPIYNCLDHLGNGFNCMIVNFNSTIHPTIGTFPGSGEDTYDLDMTLLRL
jgi:hypothetical protein